MAHLTPAFDALIAKMVGDDVLPGLQCVLLLRMACYSLGTIMHLVTDVCKGIFDKRARQQYADALDLGADGGLYYDFVLAKDAHNYDAVHFQLLTRVRGRWCEVDINTAMIIYSVFEASGALNRQCIV